MEVNKNITQNNSNIMSEIGIVKANQTINFHEVLLTLAGFISIGYVFYQIIDYLLGDGKEERTPRVFISHSWELDKDYRTLIKRFRYHGFEFYNHSIPEEKAIDTKETKSIENAIRRKIIGCSKVLVLGGNYANTYWIKKEVQIAKELKKEIIVIKPRSNTSIPDYLKYSADKLVGYNAKIIIGKLKQN